MTRKMTRWIRAPLGVAALAGLASTSGCIPITLKTERVEPTVSVTDIGPDWNPRIAPDARRKFVSDVRHALLEKRKSVEFVESDELWRESFQRERPGSVQQASDLLDALNGDEAERLGLRCLIVLGPPVIQLHDTSQDLLPFYSSGPQRTLLQAVVLQWGPAENRSRHVQALAQGIEREGWFPGTPLMFTRLYKKVDTDGAAFRGLVKALLAELPAEDIHGAVRIALLAEIDDKTETAK